MLSSAIFQVSLSEGFPSFPFAAIVIPARSFLHLTEREERIRWLENILAHVEPNGRLLLNFFNHDLTQRVARAGTASAYEPFKRCGHSRPGLS